jgi:hypothetical protein
MAMPIHIILQTGNVTSVNAVVQQFLNQVGIPLFQIVLVVGGLSLVISIIMVILYTVEYMWHPTSFGRTSALTESIFHSKKLIYGPLGLFLSIYISLLVIGLASGNPTLVQNAGTYALDILRGMLTETANLFGYLIKHAVSATP